MAAGGWSSSLRGSSTGTLAPGRLAGRHRLGGLDSIAYTESNDADFRQSRQADTTLLENLVFDKKKKNQSRGLFTMNAYHECLSVKN